MKNTSPVIAGIDPGTTVGLAIFDLDGRLLYKGSGKGLSLAAVIRIVSGHGLPVIMSADKARLPGFVRQLRAKLGSRLLLPDKDLTVHEKRQLTCGMAFENDHERDAAASALWAYREVRGLIRKINKALEKAGKESLRTDVSRLMLLSKNPLPALKTAALLEADDQTTKDAAQKLLLQQDSVRELCILRERYSRAVRENQLLRKFRSSQEHLAAAKAKRVVRRKVVDPTLKNRLDISEARSLRMQKELLSLASALEEQKRKTSLLECIFASQKDYVPALVLQSLGREADLSGLRTGMPVIAEDTAAHSRATTDALHEKTTVIIGTPRRHLSERFVFIDPKKLKISKFSRFAAVERKGYEAQLGGRRILDKLLDEYRK